MKSKIKEILKQVEDLQQSILDLKPDAIRVRDNNIAAEKSCLELKGIVTRVLESQILEEDLKPIL